MVHSFFDSRTKISREHLKIVLNDILGAFYEIPDFLERERTGNNRIRRAMN